jgi:hypothetical protein
MLGAALTLTLSQWERGLTELSGEIHRPEKSSRLWIQSESFKSVNLASIPNRFSLPVGEETDRVVWRKTPT